jgi:hypothetical protein
VRQIAPVLVVTKNTKSDTELFVYYFTLAASEIDSLHQINSFLWFSGTSKQFVVLNSQAFIGATKYIPPQVSGDICDLRTAVCHALRTFWKIHAKAAALPKLRSNYAAPSSVTI